MTAQSPRMEELSLVEEGSVLLFRANTAKSVLAYYRNIQLVHERMGSLGAASLLIDGSEIRTDLSSDQLALAFDTAEPDSRQSRVRIAAVLDEALASLRLLLSLIFNQGHSVAVFDRYADAAAWIRTNAELLRDAPKGARGGVRVW